MSKLTLRGEIMLHYAAMLSMNCLAGTCADCPFGTSQASCILSDWGPAQWNEIIERIRKEATNGTQEDHF